MQHVSCFIWSISFRLFSPLLPSGSCMCPPIILVVCSPSSWSIHNNNVTFFALICSILCVFKVTTDKERSSRPADFKLRLLCSVHNTLQEIGVDGAKLVMWSDLRGSLFLNEITTDYVTIAVIISSSMDGLQVKSRPAESQIRIISWLFHSH